MAGTDFSHLTNDELIKGIKALKLPDYIRSKAYGVDVRETLAQMTEMLMQLAYNQGMDPQQAQDWVMQISKIDDKADQSFVDSQLSAIVSGAPKGTFTDLVALQTAHPNGTDGVFLVLENGHWYYWNDTLNAWADGGVYQASGIADGTITDSKIESVDYTKVKVDSDTSLKDVNDEMLDAIYPYYLKSTSVSEQLTEDSLIKIGEYRNTSDVDIKSLEVNSKNLLTLKPGEYVKNEIYYNLYDKVTFKSLVKNYAYISTDSIRVMYTLPNNDFISDTNRYSAFAPNTKFLPEKQINFSTNSGNFIGLHSNLTVHINFTKSEITGAGFSFDNEGLTNYISTLSDFDIFIRRNNYKELKGNFKLQIPKGDLIISKSQDMSLSVDIFQKSKALLGTNFKKYFASVKNRLKSTSAERPVKLYASFEYGVCLDEDHIVVYDNEGNIIPHQWEDDYHVNYKIGDNFGRYSDGSLKDGYIYLMDTFGDEEEKTYSIHVYQSSVSRFESNVIESNTNKDFKIVTGDLSIDFLEANKYLITEIKKNNTTRVFDQNPAYKTSLDNTISVRDEITTQVKSFNISGSGVTFKKANLVLTNGLFDITVITKIFANQEIEISTSFKAIRNIGATECYGTMSRINFSVGDATPVANEKLVSFGWTDSTDSLNKSARLLYAHGDWPRDASTPPRPRYREFATMIHSFGTATDVKRLIGGWQYGSNDTPFDIPVDEVFTSGILINLGGYKDSHKDEDDRSYNKLVGRLTNQTKLNMKSSILSKASENIRNVQLDPDGNYESAYLAYAGKIADWKMFGVGNLDTLFDNFKNNIQTSYGGNDVESIYTKYISGGMGLNVSCRTLLPPAIYLRKEYLEMGDLEKVSFCETLLKSYAEVLCRAYEEFGFVPMRYSSTATGSPSNATASALRGLATGIYLDETNERWNSAYTGLETYFAKFLPVKNVISDSDTATFPSYQYLHYSTFAAFEYLKATEYINKTPIVNMTQYSFNATSAYGAAREQEYCISSSRRGLGHTSAYLIYMLLKEDTVSSVAQAEKIIGRLLAQNKPEGGHEFPLEQWRYEPAQSYSASAPFETQVLAEVVYLLLDQHIKSKY